MDEEITKKALIKIADSINSKRRSELFKIFSGQTDHLDTLKALRNTDEYRYGSKSKVWRKIASLPVEVDKFFSDIYGKDYWRDPEFFTKRYTEWAVIDSKYLKK